MAKKTLLSESQVSKFMKLANIKSDKINGFKKRLNENFQSGYTMGEDEEAADAGPSDEGDDMGMDDEAADMDMDMEGGDEGGMDMDAEPEAPQGDIEVESEELGKLLEPIVQKAVAKALASAGLTGGEDEDMDMGDMDMDLESDEMTDEDEGGMEDEGDMDMDMEEEGEGEEEEEEEQELQEAKKKAMKADKKTRNLEGGDAKKKMLLFVAGMIFHKTWNSFLNFGMLLRTSNNVAKQLLLSLVLIEQDIKTISEYKKLVFKEKGMSDQEIENYMKTEDKMFFMWREKVVLTLLNNFPQEFKKACLPFNDWIGAASYINTITKNK